MAGRKIFWPPMSISVLMRGSDEGMRGRMGQVNILTPPVVGEKGRAQAFNSVCFFFYMMELRDYLTFQLPGKQVNLHLLGR